MTEDYGKSQGSREGRALLSNDVPQANTFLGRYTSRHKEVVRSGVGETIRNATWRQRLR